MVCKLTKSLYGLKQASKQWFAKLLQELLTQGYKQSKSDYSLFTKRTQHTLTILAVYVDDIILTGNDRKEIQQIKQHLDKTFSINDLGKLYFVLGIEVHYLTDGIVLSQYKFTKDLLQEHSPSIKRKCLTPLPIHIKLSALEGTPMEDPTPLEAL